MNEIAAPNRFDFLEAKIARLPAGEAPITNHFARGVYGREMKIPKGTVLTGKIHLHDCLNVVFGDITVFNEIEGASKRISGFSVFKSPAGTRRAGMAHEDTIWITFHPNPDDGQDLDKIEQAVIEPHENPLLTSRESLELQEASK